MNNHALGFDAPQHSSTQPDAAVRADIIALLREGGDARITDCGDGYNRYFATAEPFAGLAYGSTTISSISHDALAHLTDMWWPLIQTPLSPCDYAARLDALRARIRVLHGHSDTAVIFSASGTDLEYVGLALAHDNRPRCAILLGRDEVGSGCIHSALGRHFSEQTAIGHGVTPGEAIDAAHAHNRLEDVPLRLADGTPRTSGAIVADIIGLADTAIAAGEHPVIHIVHGSKTGLTLPDMAGVRQLRRRYQGRASLVVDACQLRIMPGTVRTYLGMGVTVLLTGSKFAGGPPFSGMALVPGTAVAAAAPLTSGYAVLARSAEWPANWPGADQLPELSCPALLLRYAAALFEIDRFWLLNPADRRRVKQHFLYAARELARRLGMATIATSLTVNPDSRLAAETLVTLDLASRWPECDLALAGRIQQRLALGQFGTCDDRIRLGQPVKCRPLADGRWAGTLRLSLSMPLVVELTALSGAALPARLDRDMGQIASAIEAAHAIETGN